jgi:hypothetical protein
MEVQSGGTHQQQTKVKTVHQMTVRYGNIIAKLDVQKGFKSTNLYV